MKRYRREMILNIEGYSLIEMMLVIAILAIILGIATPSFLQWRQSLEFRQTSREIMSALRQAKSQAITTNLEQQVTFESANNRYGSQVGNRAYNATTWSPSPITNWTSVSSLVRLLPNATVQFAPDGTAKITAGAINIQDINGKTWFNVVVTTTGRISVNGPF